MKSGIQLWAVRLSCLVASAAATSSLAAATLYTETNAANANYIQIYRGDVQNNLALVGSVGTGGKGTGAGLGNQGALALSDDARWLFAVNAGSNDISVFAVTQAGLTLVERTASGGLQPISLTTHHGRLYVLNSGGAGNVAGFSVEQDGSLEPIAGSVQPLSGSAVAPAQVGVDKDNDVLVVTEKATNQFALYAIAESGALAGPVSVASHGVEPFGFAFDRGTLLVSEAFGGAANASALSSYSIHDDDGAPSLQLISGSVPTKQTAACWTVTARHGRYAYVANTGSGTLTGYRVSYSGDLERLSAGGVSASPGGKPTDMTTNWAGDALFVLSTSTGKIASYNVRADGSLEKKASATGIPTTATGLVAD